MGFSPPLLGQMALNVAIRMGIWSITFISRWFQHR
jgi:hypothetical protein